MYLGFLVDFVQHCLNDIFGLIYYRNIKERHFFSFLLNLKMMNSPPPLPRPMVYLYIFVIFKFISNYYYWGMAILLVHCVLFLSV